MAGQVGCYYGKKRLQQIFYTKDATAHSSARKLDTDLVVWLTTRSVILVKNSYRTIKPNQALIQHGDAVIISNDNSLSGPYSIELV